MSIRIILADDHTMLREGLRALIEEQPAMTVIAMAEEGRSTVRLAEKLRPDIIVMDISMPGMNGMEATRQILAKDPGIKILALSMHTDRRFVVEMLSAGASGYLLKDCAFEELISALHALADKRTYLSPKISDVVVKDYSGRSSMSATSALVNPTASKSWKNSTYTLSQSLPSLPSAKDSLPCKNKHIRLLTFYPPRHTTFVHQEKRG